MMGQEHQSIDTSIPSSGRQDDWVRYPSRKCEGLVSVLHINSVDCSTTSASTYDTSQKPEDFTGHPDKVPVLVQHAEPEALPT